MAVKESKVYPAPTIMRGSSNQPAMSKLRILKNLLVICLGYLFLFTAYQGLANLQSTLNIEDNAGIISQSVLYASVILSCLFLPKLVIRKYGLKVTLVVSALLYAPYVAASFYPKISTFIPAAIISGVAAPALWSAKCTYVNEISTFYASQTSDSADVVTARFFGIFFMMFQSTQIFGNLVSFYVLKPTVESYDNVTDMNVDYNETVSCGINFCFEINENLKSPSDEKRYILISIYVLCVFLSGLVMGLFLDSYERVSADDAESLLSRALATFRHLKKPKQMLLLPITVFSGLDQGFFLGDFTRAYVACAWGIYHVGLVFIVFGVVDAIVSFAAGRLIKFVPRFIIIGTAALGNITVCLTLILWHPNSDQKIVFFILAGIWGLSDGIWQTLLNSFYGVLFRSEEEAAYANYRLWESLGFIIAFVCGSLLCIESKIFIVLTVLALGMMGYITVEFILLFERKSSK